MTNAELIQTLEGLQRRNAYVADDGCKCCDSYVAFEDDDAFGEIVMYDEIQNLIDQLKHNSVRVDLGFEDDGSEEIG